MQPRMILFLAPLLVQFSFAESPDLAKSSAGRSFGKGLKLKSSKVPQYDLSSQKSTKYLFGAKKESVFIKQVPLLDVGEEATLSASAVPINPVDKKELRLKTVQKLSQQKIPSLDQLLKQKPSSLKEVKQIQKINSSFKAPAVKELSTVADPQFQESNPQLIQPKILSEAEEKLLQALIFAEHHKNYALALGLLSEVAKNDKLATDVAYHIGHVARQLGLYTEFRSQLLKVLSNKDREWQKKATLSLMNHIALGDQFLLAKIDPKVEEFKFEMDKADFYLLNRAKFYMEKGNLTQALASLEDISKDSSQYPASLFLKSLISYRAGEVDDAIYLQNQALKLIENSDNEELKSVASMTLARLYFQLGNYKESYEMYLKVDKRHPLWLQAMVERAWSQILSQDYEGAAGNMFSMHTDFFKGAFQPESYIVRAVAYLNLCQFADGAKALQDFKKKYSNYGARMEAFEKQHPKTLDYYETLKSWLQRPEQKDVNGLPRPFLFELARHPSFTDQQVWINNLEDENKKIQQISLDIVNRERTVFQKIQDTKAKIEKNRSVAETSKDSDAKKKAKEENIELEKKLPSFQWEYEITKRARTSLKDLREVIAARIEVDKVPYREAAGKSIANRFGQLKKELIKTMDQSEVLQYELYSGAGEQMRYQQAGGEETKKDKNAESKPRDDKAVRWEFKGEVWEDEIGHFRSSLKSACPPDEKRE